MSKKTFYIALVSTLALMCFSLWRMYNLPLWGHYSLLYLLGLWGVANVMTFKFAKYDLADLRLMRWPLLGAVLLSIGFPPYPIIGAAFIGFVPFFIHRIKTQEAAYKRRRYNFQLFSGLWLWNILTTFWVENTLFGSGILANTLNALLMMIPFIIYGRIEKYIPSKWIKYFGFISFWICYEMLHLYWDISWPWLILGHQFAHVPALIQWYEYTGVLGGTLWILLLNFFAFEYWLNKKSALPNQPNMIKIGLLILVPIIFSITKFYTYTPIGNKAEVLVIQPNLNPHYAKATMPYLQQLNIYLDLIDENITDSTKYILMPESALKRIRKSNLKSNNSILRLNKILKNYPKVAIMTGATMIEQWKKEAPKNTDNLRIHHSEDGSKLYWKVYNSALFLQYNKDTDFYYKSKFVPGAEFIPYPDIFFFIQPFADALGGSIEGMGRQNNRNSFANNELSMAPVICYESIYGQYTSRYITQGGATALGIVTIDGWWDNTSGHIQHLYLGALRAIENRKDIARSAVTGISGFIDQRGVVTDRTSYDTMDAMRKSIYFNDKITFYAKYGDFIGRIALFMALIAIFNAIRVVIEKKKDIL